MIHNWIEAKLDYFRYIEKKHITDRNKDIYYIIRRKPLWEGFFSNYFYVLSNIIYADQHGWKSVVDMQNYPTLYSEENEYHGILNSWEYYFKQPDRIHIEEAYASGNYVLSKNQYYGDLGVPVYHINQGHITEEMVRKLYLLQSERIPVHKEILDECSSLYKKYISDQECIGVHIRGTDMNEKRKFHSIPPRIINISNKVDELLEGRRNFRIFLWCDEIDAVNWFKEKYGDMVFSLNAYRSSGHSSVGIHKQNFNRSHHHYLLGREVLLDALLLSKCDYLICGVSNVTSAAVMFNNLNYKKTIVLKQR